MTVETINTIKTNATYKAVLADSFGGCIYNVANRGKYNPTSVDWIIQAWDGLTPSQQSSAGGIMRGAVAFLKGE